MPFNDFLYLIYILARAESRLSPDFQLKFKAEVKGRTAFAKKARKYPAEDVVYTLHRLGGVGPLYSVDVAYARACRLCLGDTSLGRPAPPDGRRGPCGRRVLRFQQRWRFRRGRQPRIIL